MNIKRLYHTIKHLRFEQVYYRLYYKIKRRFYKPPHVPAQAIQAALSFPSIPFTETETAHHYTSDNNTFSFINQSHSFGDTIDWNYADLGKLWVYNLNYFEWLEDGSISIADKTKTIENHCLNISVIKDGMEPYPLSLRGVNWIKFLSRHTIKDENISKCLYVSYHKLSAFTEYHILANHLLENGFSLFFGAHYFNHLQWFKEAHKILTEQLQEQILPDGAHYETSPMYHCILLQRLFSCIELARGSDRFTDPGLLSLMEEKAGKMVGWLHAFLLDNGNYAMVGDAAPDIAPTPQSLFRQAIELDIAYTPAELKECGFRKIKFHNWELVVDMGDIQPSYQPGHTHADTFHFELYKDGQPILVDTGISTYELGEQRDRERSTRAHNTVEINGFNSSDVWNRFRVGRRAKVLARQEGDHYLMASHDGYKKEGIIHERKFSWDNQKIIIEDRLKGYNGQNALLYLHFHPLITVQVINGQHFEAGGVQIKVEGAVSCMVDQYNYCEGYNRLTPAQQLVIEIKERSTLSIEL